MHKEDASHIEFQVISAEYLATHYEMGGAWLRKMHAI